MLSRLIRMKWPIPVAAVVMLVAVVGVALASTGVDKDVLVIYNGRSHYGDEAAFTEFSERTGIEIELRGGTAPELYERLRQEGEDTPADLLVTTDLANLWRATEASLLQSIESDRLDTNVPSGLHHPDGYWWAITTRLRVPVVATERVAVGRVTSYIDFADPEFRGRTCLRTSQNEYNQSFVADRIAKHGIDATRALLQSWMDNDPKIINSDGEILGAMASGECDLALVNHYYLARRIADDAAFPVAPAWPDQDGAGAHTNVSGAGVVADSDMVEEATMLIEFLTEEWAQSEIASRGEFPVNEAVPPADHIAEWDDVVLDPIDVEAAGPLLQQAIELMLEVGVDLTTAPVTADGDGGSRWRMPSWTLLGIAVALLVAGPLVALPASFIGEGEAFSSIGRTLLPRALWTSFGLGLGVGVGTLVVGGGLATLVSFYDFPGRRILDWALVLPLAMPGYVLVFVLLGQYGTANPLQSNLFGEGLRFSGIRSPVSAVLILTGVLYPYVYVLGRSAFLSQSRQSLEAARSLGLSYGAAVRRVALPLARPSLAAGAALAIMETLADFGTVDLLGIQALTSAIYRVWYGAFDQAAALQLATVLVGLALTMVAIERLLRGRARYHQHLGTGDAVTPHRLQGPVAVAAAVPGWLLLGVVFFVPITQLAAWSIETIREDALAADLWSAARNTLTLGALAAVVAVVTATVVAYGQRSHPSRVGQVAARLSTLGYAVPGTVVAVAVYVPLVWVDRRLVGIAESWLDRNVGLLFTGTILGLVLAYVVRFQALAYFAMESRMGRIDTNLDDAARSLGADRARVLADVHVPLLLPGFLTAALLVLVEVMKELPTTALLRPLGGDTLAITVWEATKDSRFDVAALPALLIVLVGLVPVIVLVRLLRNDGWRSAADSFG